MTTPKKKGMSIGASLRGRMDPEAGALVEKPLLEEIAPPAPSLPRAVESVPVETPESFNTRLRPSLQRRLKMFAAAEGVKIQDIVDEALHQYLEQKEKK